MRKDGDGSDWLCLTLAHWQLGDKEAARGWYERASQWMREKRPERRPVLLTG